MCVKVEGPLHSLTGWRVSSVTTIKLCGAVQLQSQQGQGSLAPYIAFAIIYGPKSRPTLLSELQAVTGTCGPFLKQH